MTFPCSDPLGCTCECHVSWTTHVPVCRECLVPLRDSVGCVLAEDAVIGTCPSCRHTWFKPTPHPDDARPWEWKHRDLFDHHDLIPAGEAAELATSAEPPETAPMDQEPRR